MRWVDHEGSCAAALWGLSHPRIFITHQQKAPPERVTYLAEHIVAELKSQLPTWWQMHEGLVTGRNPCECERKVTPRPPGAGIFHGSMDELRADVVRNGLGVVEGGRGG